MIAKLRGRVDSVGEDWLVLDVGGVGYLLFCSRRTITALSNQHDSITLFVSPHIREDHIHLYGFSEEPEREWFLLLQSVQGVGAKVALGILSALDLDALRDAVVSGDHSQFRRVNGVGPKVANRLVVELADKVEGQKFSVGALATKASAIGVEGPVAEAISALVNLGYGRPEAQGAILEASRSDEVSDDLSSLIHAGLKGLGR
ncbi:MAG: Holliday junction branch migration protein RuvA [Pseudomonadota bacterium]|nr:Holliday junction branch migration protein RuvA [Pseudomonadota bacterium]